MCYNVINPNDAFFKHTDCYFIAMLTADIEKWQGDMFLPAVSFKLLICAIPQPAVCLLPGDLHGQGAKAPWESNLLCE